ncbi:MAG: phosphatase PAP2 family protein [Thermomicrobiales bacterium]
MSEPISPEPPESPQESKPSLRAALSARDPNAIKAAIRPSHILRLVLAVVLMIVSYYTNRGFLGWGLLFILGVLVVPVGRTRAFLIGFIPYAGVWFLFTVGRSLADETIFARTVNLYVPDFERQLFNDRLPTVRLQDRFFTPGDPGPLDYFMTGVHWSYFIIPHVFAVIIWYKRPELFLRFFSAMTLMLGIGLAIYFLIPTNPPWLAPEPINSPSAAVVYRVMESVGKAIGGGIYEASYAVIGESNPRAAMPSIHLAFTALLIFPAFAFGKKWGYLFVIYTALMGFALVYMGEHYVTDLAVGFMCAAYGWYGAGAWWDIAAPNVFGSRNPMAGLTQAAATRQAEAASGP